MPLRAAHELVDDYHFLKAKVLRVHRALQHTASAENAGDDQADAIWLRLAKETDDVLERRRILWVDAMLARDFLPEGAAATAKLRVVPGEHACKNGARKATYFLSGMSKCCLKRRSASMSMSSP